MKTNMNRLVRISYKKKLTKNPYRDCARYFIAQRILNRPLRKNEEVHHINGDHWDNRNNNLLICTDAYHTWLHSRMKIRENIKKYGIKVRKLFLIGYSSRHISEKLKISRMKVLIIMRELGFKREKSEAEKLKRKFRKIPKQPHKYTDEFILAEIKRASITTKQKPLLQETFAEVSEIGFKTVYKYLGSWSEAKMRAKVI